MRRITSSSSTQRRQYQVTQRIRSNRRARRQPRPAATYRHRGIEGGRQSQAFSAPEVWHETNGCEDVRYIVEPPGAGYMHAVTPDEVQERIERLPGRFTCELDVVQFSRMTKKRALFPCYGMQWGSAIYLYPIEESLVETYVRTPRPQQLIEARMYGGKWTQKGDVWVLAWTEKAVKDFYLNNVLVHEIGHIYDDRNINFEARERYANWFAIEYGYRASRGRR